MGMEAKIILVGNPNVGKSAIFNLLTGVYTSVSNYPGTTVDVFRGRCRLGGREFEVIDTPGMYSLSPLTEEERIARWLLFREQPAVVLHVIDAKNINRMLGLTLELLTAKLPVVVVLNIMDEAQKLGMSVDAARLSQMLGVPVVAMAATRGQGFAALQRVLLRQSPPCDGSPSSYDWSPRLNTAVQAIAEHLHGDYHGMPANVVAAMLLQDDEEIWQMAKREHHYRQLRQRVAMEQGEYEEPLSFVMAVERQRLVRRIVKTVVKQSRRATGSTIADVVGDWCTRPLTGLPILAAILYFGLYKFVGVFGAGVAVDFLSVHVFDGFLTPGAVRLTETYLPWPWLQDLIVGPYGLFTMGIRYAVAIVIPIAATFFLAFAVLEDSGYLPRLALLADAILKPLGLTGRAVIPLTLGLGCGTMAVMVSRVLETRRERFLVTLLLALAVPCSAQLGVVLGILSHNQLVLLLWGAIIGSVFLTVGRLAAWLLPGRPGVFYMELPPLRLPSGRNMLLKAFTRLRWYFREVLPIFIATSLLLWWGDITGVLAVAMKWLAPIVTGMGLPEVTAQVFLLGFFRRDYGAAGLYELQRVGLLHDGQLLVAAVVLTLFVPCITQWLITVRERGLLVALALSAAIFPFAFIMGWLIHMLLLVLALDI